MTVVSAGAPLECEGEALGDLRVLDLSEGIARAVAAMMFADHGAHVVRPVGAPPRDEPPSPGELAWHRNKVVATFDPASAAHHEHLRGAASYEGEAVDELVRAGIVRVASQPSG